MRITANKKTILDSQLKANAANGDWNNGTPPWAVIGTVAALIYPADIVESFTAATSTSDITVWSVWALTSTALAHIGIQFDAAKYGQWEENDRWTSNQDAARFKILEATLDWPLADVTRMEFLPHAEYQSTQKPVDGNTSFFPTPGIKLTFADGRTFALQGQAGLRTDAERLQSDKFIAAVLERLSVQRLPTPDS